jgi:hypothetical protein
MKLVLLVLGILLGWVAYAQTIINPYEQRGAAATVPAYSILDVQVNDSCSQWSEPPRALWVGNTGNVRVTTWNNETVTITNVQGGSLLPIIVRCVHATGSTATSMQVWF